MSRKIRPMSEFAVFRADDWTSMCDQEAARWLRAGCRPDELDPATGVPLEGAFDRVDPDADPSVAESALRASDPELDRIERRLRLATVVTAVVVVLGTVGVGLAIAALGGGS